MFVSKEKSTEEASSEESIVEHVRDILLETISKTENIEQHNEIINIAENVNPFSSNLTTNKASEPGKLFSGDCKEVFNFDENIPHISYVEAKIIPPRITLVYLSKYIFKTEDDPGDPDSRSKFLRNICIIFIVQLLFTLAFVCCCFFVEETRKFFEDNSIMSICSLALAFMLFIVLINVQAMRKAFPYNYIILIILTISTSYAALAYQRSLTGMLLLIICGGTLGVLLIVGLIGWLNFFDSTRILAVTEGVFTSSIIFFAIIGILLFHLTGNKLVIFILSVFYLLILCIAIIFFLQLLLGKGKFCMGTDDQILAITTMYGLSVTCIFILSILAKGP